MRLKWIKLKFDFLANFHKLMNNASYGWFCRPVETYKNTTLLFSGKKSYDHFENFNSDSLTDAESLQEQALIVVNNPHDSQLEKKEKIENIYDRVKDKAKKLISRHRNYIINTRDERLHSTHKKKIKFYENYILEVNIGRIESVAMFELYSKLKESEENTKRLECEGKNKKFYTIPDRLKPKGRTELKTRSESISAAMYGKSNSNVDVVLFNKDSLHSICFGMISSTRQQITMKSNK